MTLEEKVQDQLIGLGQQADEIVRLQAKLKESEGKLQALTKDAERADEARLEQIRAAERLIDSQRSRLQACEATMKRDHDDCQASLQRHAERLKAVQQDRLDAQHRAEVWLQRSEMLERRVQAQAERALTAESRLESGKKLVADLVAWILSDELIGEDEGSFDAITARAEAFQNDRLAEIRLEGRAYRLEVLDLKARTEAAESKLTAIARALDDQTANPIAAIRTVLAGVVEKGEQVTAEDVCDTLLDRGPNG